MNENPNRPIVSSWELFFAKEHGYENRETVMRAFAAFWNDPNADRLDIPGKCMLGGSVTGHRKFHDGDVILTSDVQSIERVERDTSLSVVTHDLMCATTQSGSKYYFYIDELLPQMAAMLEDLARDGKLSRVSHVYLSFLWAINDLSLL